MNSQPPRQHPPLAPTGAPQPVRHPEAPISPAQHRRLEARISQLGLDRERVKAWTSKAWGIGSLVDLTPARYQELNGKLVGWAEQCRLEAEARREAAEERAAIQAENEPIDLSGWIEDYNQTETKVWG